MIGAMSTEPSTENKAAELLRLHRDPTLLTVVNVWDSISAKVVAETPGTAALATASHSIAASWGYEDGENIPVDLMVEAVGPDRDGDDAPGHRRPRGRVRRPRRDRPQGDRRRHRGRQHRGPDASRSTRRSRSVTAIMDAAIAEGVPDFVLNARTDVFVRAGDRDPAEVLADAVERGKAFLDAGAPVVFVPGRLDEEQVTTLVEAFGPQRLTAIGVPGGPSLARLEELGVARVSYGPMSQRVALTALQELVEEVHRGGGVPSTMRALN